ncbi:MAG TPA: hypothetical protein VFG76_06895 [Candidatus Polarisedimenticolia bacterium]|nr:hypothetical protein [Candidatus Polarisedimenticolia bacterium]
MDLSTGLTGVNLEAPSKLLYPLLSPFRQTIGRETRPGSQADFFRILSVVPGGRFSSAAGTRSNGFTITKDKPSFNYKSYGQLGDFQWEAQYAGMNLEDIRKRVKTLNLLGALQREEGLIFGGNITALGTPTGVVTATATTGGTIAAATYQVRVAALTWEGMRLASRVARTATDAAQSFDASLIVPTQGGTIGITAAAANTPIVTTGATSTITVTWNAIAGAFGYAVYIDNHLQCVLPSQTKVTFTAISTTGEAVPAGDSTASATDFDGIVPQIVAAATGPAKKRVNGNLGTPSGNQITVIADAIQDVYDRFKVQPSRLLVAWDVHDQLDRKLASVANDRVNLNYIVGPDGPKFEQLRFYPSPIDGRQIPIEQQPNLFGGMVLGVLDDAPIADSQIPAAWKMLMGSDWVELAYAIVNPKEEYEQRAFGALAGYCAVMQFILYDIQRG